MYSHILVPTDGSDLAQNGVNHALSLAKALGSKVTIITVSRPFIPPGMEGEWIPPAADRKRFEDELERSALDLLTKTKADAEKMGLNAGTEHVRDDSAAIAIVDAAERLGCSLIVMSSHGRRGISRILLGSQTAEVLAHSPVPVLVIR